MSSPGKGKAANGKGGKGAKGAVATMRAIGAKASKHAGKAARKFTISMLDAETGFNETMDRAAQKVSDSKVGKAATAAAHFVKSTLSKAAGRVVAVAEASHAASKGHNLEAMRIIGTQGAVEAASDVNRFAGVGVTAASSAAKNLVTRFADKLRRKEKSAKEAVAAPAATDALVEGAEMAAEAAAGAFASSKRRRVVRRKAPVRRNAPVRRPVGRRMRAAKVKVSRSGNNKAYCLRCRRKVQIVGPKMKRTKRGSPFLQGTCPHCSGKVACFQRK